MYGAGCVITIGLSVERLSQMSQSLAAVGGALIPTMVKTANRGIWRYVVDRVKADVSQASGIGRTIWGRDDSGLDKQGLVRPGRLLIGADKTWGQASLKLRGIPSLLEQGGRIKPHTIRSGFGRTGKRMPHPGMTLRPHGYGKRAMDAGETRIREDIDAAVGEMLKRRGL